MSGMQLFRKLRIGPHVKFLLLVIFSMDFTLFHKGQSTPSSRVRDYVINDQNALMPYIFWKPWMSPKMIWGLFVNIWFLKWGPMSTHLWFWITVQLFPKLHFLNLHSVWVDYNFWEWKHMYWCFLVLPRLKAISKTTTSIFTFLTHTSGMGKI